MLTRYERTMRWSTAHWCFQRCRHSRSLLQLQAHMATWPTWEPGINKGQHIPPFWSSTNTQNISFSYPVCMFPCCCRLKLNPLKRIGTNTSEIHSQISNRGHIVASRNCALLQSNNLLHMGSEFSREHNGDQLHDMTWIFPSPNGVLLKNGPNFALRYPEQIFRSPFLTLYAHKSCALSNLILAVSDYVQTNKSASAVHWEEQ